jgi:hypothetical protein
MRVELTDSEGNRYTVAFEGQITRDKAIRVLDIVELLGGMPGEHPASLPGSVQSGVVLSRFEKVRSLVQKSFPLVWFSSRDVQSVFEQDLKEPIALSTVSTYLARMVNKGFLLRTGNANSLKYKMSTATPQAVIKQKMK